MTERLDGEEITMRGLNSGEPTAVFSGGQYHRRKGLSQQEIDEFLTHVGEQPNQTIIHNLVIKEEADVLLEKFRRIDKEEALIRQLFPSPSEEIERATAKAVAIVGALIAKGDSLEKQICSDLFTGLRDPDRQAATIERINSLYEQFKAGSNNVNAE
jgi:hypothetical protein